MKSIDIHLGEFENNIIISFWNTLAKMPHILVEGLLRQLHHCIVQSRLQDTII